MFNPTLAPLHTVRLGGHGRVRGGRSEHRRRGGGVTGRQGRPLDDRYGWGGWQSPWLKRGRSADQAPPVTVRLPAWQGSCCEVVVLQQTGVCLRLHIYPPTSTGQKFCVQRLPCPFPSEGERSCMGVARGGPFSHTKWAAQIGPLPTHEGHLREFCRRSAHPTAPLEAAVALSPRRDLGRAPSIWMMAWNQHRYPSLRGFGDLQMHGRCKSLSPTPPGSRMYNRLVSRPPTAHLPTASVKASVRVFREGDIQERGRPREKHQRV
jgi:hypothetical protein